LGSHGLDVPEAPRIIFPWTKKICRVCGNPLRIRRTKPRNVVSLAYGSFAVVERQGYCPLHPKLPVARSDALSRIVAPGAEYAYDVIAKIGLERFLQCRQEEEIQRELTRAYTIEVPVGTIGHLGRKFVAYFQLVHQQSIGPLRADMKSRGGYILHIDGTCEEGSRVLLVCMDSLSGQILQSRKIGSENTAEIKAVLKDMRRDWGVPLAIVHDLRQSLIHAAGTVFKGVPQFICHYHLAADVGEDILSGHVNRLRCLFRRTKMRPKLRLLMRSLKDLAVCEQSGEHVVTCILSEWSNAELQKHCTTEVAGGLVHGLAAWILSFSQQGEGYGFPFDLPYLNLYDRVVSVHGMLREVTAGCSSMKRGPLGALNRLKGILAPVISGKNANEIHGVVEDTRRDLKIFDRFRVALRICPKGGKKRKNDEGALNTLSSRRHKAVLARLRASLNRHAKSGLGSAKASKIVVDHLDKYWHLLFGHVLRKSGRRIVVPRTNNVEESFFRIVKRQCRRLHGRGSLTRDIDCMLPAVPLVLNLRNPNYTKTVYGGAEVEKIAQAFSAVDPDDVSDLLRCWRQEKLSIALPQKLAGLTDLPGKLQRFASMMITQLHADPNADT
jgi:hypothetical protein